MDLKKFHERVEGLINIADSMIETMAPELRHKQYTEAELDYFFLLFQSAFIVTVKEEPIPEVIKEMVKESCEIMINDYKRDNS